MPDPLMQKVVSLGMEHVAVTDHGTMSQLLKAQQAADKAGVHLIHGCEVYYTPDRHVKDPEDKYNHLTLLAANDEGLKGLYKMTNRAYREGFYHKPRVDAELLREFAGGANSGNILVMSGCMAGRTMQALMNEDGRFKSDQERLQAARDELLVMIEAVGKDNVYAELQNVGIELPCGSQRGWNRDLGVLADDLGLLTVGTSDVHYLEEAHHDPHEVMLCSQSKRTLDDPKRLSFAPYKYYVRSEAEMAALLSDRPECLANTLIIAERCDAHIKTTSEDPNLMFEFLPTFPVPEDFDHGEVPDGIEPAKYRQQAYLRHVAWEGLHMRYGAPLPAEVVERAEFELTTINSMGVTDYFLIVGDMVGEAKRRGISVGPGRGSGAGSIILYALNVTQLDPLAYDLLFERFLNPDRISMPDVDLDFAVARRTEMMDYMREKYGDAQCAQIITFSRIGSKAGIRRAAGALGKEYLPLADKMAKMIPTKGTVAAPLGDALRSKDEIAKIEDPKKRDKALGNASPELQALVGSDKDAKWIADKALWLEGMIAAESVHAAALIVSPVPVDNMVPVQADKWGTPVSAFDMKDAEACGALKLDFLGLRNLDIIQETEELIEKTTGQKIDAWNIPMDDRKTFEMLAKGDSVGVFQFESPGMQDSLKTVGASEFNDLIAIVALYRPGPMANIPTYAKRKKGLEPTVFPDPRLENIFGDTYGIQVYQEQAMLASQALANFTKGEADMLRKAIGKKNMKLMMEIKPKFIDGCVGNGVSKSVAEELWMENERAGDYSFNKSHAACYAFISYVTAYLKANYPAEYMAAVISSVMTTKDKTPFYVYEAKRMGLPILPPDVNHSFPRFVPNEDRTGLVYGLTAVKNVGEAIVQAIADEREANGPYKSLWDIARRVEGVNKRELEFLIKAGALDSTGATRKGMLEVVQQAVDLAKKVKKNKEAGQDSLFDNLLADPEAELAAMEIVSDPAIPSGEFGEKERFGLEREATGGLYVSGHPLDSHMGAWEQVRNIGVGQLDPSYVDKVITVCGIVTEKRVRYTRAKNERMLIVTLEDLTGAIEITFFPKTLKTEDVERHLSEGEMVTVLAKVEKDERSFSASADLVSDDVDAEGAAEAPEVSLKMIGMRTFAFNPEVIDVSEHFTITLPAQAMTRPATEKLMEVLSQHPGQTPVKFRVLFGDDEFRDYVNTEIKVERSDRLTAAMKHLMGQ